MLEEPPPTVALLRPRTQACTHRQTQTPAPTSNTRVAATLREGPTRRRQRTHLIARDDIHPGAKQTATRFAAIGDSPAARDVVGATANRGDTTSAHAGRHAQTQTQTDAGVGVKRGMDGDILRDRLADGDAHTPLSAQGDTRPPSVKKKSRQVSP